MLKFSTIILGLFFASFSFSACDELIYQDAFMVESEAFIMELFKNKNRYSEQEILGMADRLKSQFKNSDSCYASMSYYMFSRVAGLYADKYRSIEFGRQAFYTIRDSVKHREDNVIAVNGFANTIIAFYNQPALNRFAIQMSLKIDIAQEKSRALNWMNRVVGMSQYDVSLHRQLESIQLK